MPIGSARGCGGFTYLALLFAVAVMGLALAGAGQVWQTAAKREKERELLFIGNQFREAIGRYYEASPGVKQYPVKLEDLVEDKRFPKSKRHLRKIYVDPMTASKDWGLVVQQGRITGVHSRSTERPLKTGNFSKADAAFEGSETYAAWRFQYQPGAGRAAGDGGGPAPAEGANSDAIQAPARLPPTQSEGVMQRPER
jgi:type II secretory pathway pseudopilin PulG